MDGLLDLIGAFGLSFPDAMRSIAVHPADQVWRHGVRRAAGNAFVMNDIEISGGRLRVRVVAACGQGRGWWALQNSNL